MIERALGVVRFRVRASIHRRWRGYVSLVVLVGLVGGLGLGSLAAARRTQSSFSTFLGATNPSDLLVSIYGGSGSANNPNYNPALIQAIARLPHVRHVAAAMLLVGAPLTRERLTEDQGDRPGLSRRQYQRPLLRTGPAGRIEWQIAVAE